jgi:hypothetical protein
LSPRFALLNGRIEVPRKGCESLIEALEFRLVRFAIATLLAAGSVRGHFRGESSQCSLCVANTSVVPAASIPRTPPLGQRRNAGLQQLIRRDPEKICDAIQILDPDRPIGLLQRMTEPTFVVAAMRGEGALTFFPRSQQRLNVPFQDVVRPRRELGTKAHSAVNM